MGIKIIKNEFDGLYAVPDHPITCMNPAPWKITEMSIEQNVDLGLKIWIRGDGSMLFRADQCFCGDKKECEDYMTFRGIK